MDVEQNRYAVHRAMAAVYGGLAQDRGVLDRYAPHKALAARYGQHQGKHVVVPKAAGCNSLRSSADTELPEEILYHVLEFLDADALLLMSQLNHTLRALTDEKSLWRNLFLSKWTGLAHDDVKEVMSENWKSLMLRREILERNWRDGVALEQELLGHDRPVVCLDINRNSVVTGSWDETLRVWDTHSGECRHVLRGHRSLVRCVQTDDFKTVSGSSDRSVRIWNNWTGECISALTNHDASVWCLHYDDSCVASGSADSCIRLWDMRTAAVVRRFVGHAGPITSVVLCRAAQQLLTGSTDRTVRLWDTRVANRRAAEAGAVDVEDAAANAERAGAADAAGPALTLVGHRGRISKVFVCNDTESPCVVSASTTAKEVCVWDTRRANAPVHTIRCDEYGLTAFEASIKGGRITTGHTDCSVRVWSTVTGQEQLVLRAHRAPITTVSFDRRKIVSGSHDGTVRVWNASSGEEMSRLEAGERGFPLCLALKRNRLVFGTSRNGVLMYDFAHSRQDRAAKDTACSEVHCVPSSWRCNADSTAAACRSSLLL